MRLLLYYMLHSLKNQILKLCKSWVVVFILACALIGGGIGLFAGMMSEAVAPEDEYYEDEYYEDVAPEEDDFEDNYAEELVVDENDVKAISGFVCGGIILAYLLFSIYSADKSGSSIFLMADVNLLFSAPMKPQSVLMFRLLCQIGVMLASSVYIGFQIPNMYYNMGIPLVACISIIIVLILMLIYGRLISVLVYSVSSTYTSLKKFVTPVLIAIIAAISLSFLAYHASGSENLYDSADKFFNSSCTYYIPIWGWLKAIFMFALANKLLMSAVMILVCIAGIALLVWFIWSLKVDFYEDAMAKSEEMAERLEIAKSDGKQLMKRKKERKEKLSRNRSLMGEGAFVIFTKEMYNRFRFAKLYVFTKTSVTYLCISLLLSLAFDAPIELIAIVLSGMAFFRALGNTVTKEVSMETFLLIPEKPFKKMFWAHIASVCNCALDTLPAIIAATVILSSAPYKLFVYLFVIIAIDFYSSALITAIDLSLPSSIALTIKQVITVMFVYFGIVPVGICGCLIGLAFYSLPAGIIGGGAAAVIIALGAVAVSSSIISKGKK